jgi:2-polyprenyl-6-methoxyphenol hydroxylase-like FAD-dependent oxidoreductase
MDSRQMDVLVAGAGPAGLMLAGDLAALGVTVTVAERRAAGGPDLSRAFAVHARTMELLDARGLAEELIGTGKTVGVLRLFARLEVDLSRLPSRFPYLLVTPQYHTERVLRRRAESAGVRIAYGAEVVGLRQDGTGVEAEVRTGDGEIQVWRAAYLAGADGVASTVRQSLGLPFPGRSAVRSVMLADVRVTDPPPDLLTVNAVRDGFAFITSFGDGWYRVIAWDRRRQMPDTAPVDLDEVREITRLALGTDYGMHKARWLSRFHSDERQAPRYRVGRVLLAGDAAHVHSPAAGQGMNTGIQDAANLAWKLAATIQGRAAAGLLDSYQAERHPVGRRVLRVSGGLLRMAMLRPAILRTARDLIGHRLLRTRPIADKAAMTVSGIGIAYPAEAGAHRLAGTRAPDIRLASGNGGAGRLYEALRPGRFVLVSPADHPPPAAGTGANQVDAVVSAEHTRTTILVRPDAYTAWASDDTDPTRRDAALTAALARWCGPTADTATPRQL